ncbi:hypothetical protein [Methyloglobulus sp.]|uniref:hypothetical protein n=1 Tax=Methyloglobulus sp. TaxID=2518622 RepID=UPI003988DFE2
MQLFLKAVIPAGRAKARVGRRGFHILFRTSSILGGRRNPGSITQWRQAPWNRQVSDCYTTAVDK